MRLLARREHGATELRTKLEKKGFSKQEAKDALETCQNLDVQNENRYIDNYSRSRIRQGYGPLKIAQELKIKGVDGDLVFHHLKQEQDNWLDHAMQVWLKKSKGRTDLSFEEMQKMQSFLLYRGFPLDIIVNVVREL